jgi:dihydrolipoamide dehydrogenase
VKFDIAQMQKRKTGIVKASTTGIAMLLKSAGVTALQGHGKLLAGRKVEFTAHDGKTETLSAKHIVLASGSIPMELKSMPFDGKNIVDNWGALDFDSVPKKLAVVGAGVIGLELGSVWRRLGAEVVVLEALDTFLSVADRAWRKKQHAISRSRVSTSGSAQGFGREVHGQRRRSDLRGRFRQPDDYRRQAHRVCRPPSVLEEPVRRWHRCAARRARLHQSR